MQDVLFFLKRNAKDVVLFLLILLCFGFLIYDRVVKQKENDITEPIAKTSFIENDAITSTIHVDVKGAVASPGVYEVNDNAIIQDVILLAGGFLKNAYTNNINLSKKLKDQMVLYIYTTNEMKSITAKEVAKVSNQVCTTSSYTIQECVDDKISVIEVAMDTSSDDNSSIETIVSNSETDSVTTIPESSKTNLKETTKIVNLNTASKSELTTLSGIGDSKADAIIQYRTEHGSFQSISEITNVSGIGESIFAKIKNSITV